MGLCAFSLPDSEIRSVFGMGHVHGNGRDIRVDLSNETVTKA